MIKSCSNCHDWFLPGRGGVGERCALCLKIGYRTGEDLMSSFVSKMKFGPDCWEWVASFNGVGYGFIHCLGKKVVSSRFSLQMFRGVPMSGYECACHTCDNPKCVNPDHLFPGTHKNNKDDCDHKGRHSHGERHYMRKLTDEAVLDIRRRHSDGEGIRSLAKEYGVSAPNIIAIVKGHTWRHLLGAVSGTQGEPAAGSSLPVCITPT